MSSESWSCQISVGSLNTREELHLIHSNVLRAVLLPEGKKHSVCVGDLLGGIAEAKMCVICVLLDTQTYTPSVT